jgi:hypothetical protein
MADKAEKYLIWRGILETPNNCALVQWWFSRANHRLLCEIDFVDEPPNEEDVALVDQAVREVAKRISLDAKVTYVGSGSATGTDAELEAMRDSLLDPGASS